MMLRLTFLAALCAALLAGTPAALADSARVYVAAALTDSDALAGPA